MVGIKRGFALRKETSTARAGKNWISLQGIRVVKEGKHSSCKWDLEMGHGPPFVTASAIFISLQSNITSFS